MKNSAFLVFVSIAIFLAGCDVQSGIATKSVEKYVPTPTPERSIIPEEPIDPADVVQVDTTEGPQISVNPSDDKKTVECSKYNRVKINGDRKVVTVRGICKQIMVNGDNNQVLSSGFAELVLNGHENYVEYTKFANGKRPAVTDNGQGNSVSKQQAAASNSNVKK
jgi:hypothetical protein